MFSGLTSYLWGNSAVTEEETTPERPPSPKLKTSPTESDDWILVDKSRGNSPQRLEMSSMENLLIEHPSMSVYSPRHRQSSTGHESDQSQCSTSSTDNVVPSTASARHTVVHAPRRPRAVAARAGMLAQTARAAQVGQHKYQTRQLSRSALERRNRLSHFVPTMKRSRISGNMKQPSARSFNKRC